MIRPENHPNEYPENHKNEYPENEKNESEVDDLTPFLEELTVLEAMLPTPECVTFHDQPELWDHPLRQDHFEHGLLNHLSLPVSGRVEIEQPVGLLQGRALKFELHFCVKRGYVSRISSHKSCASKSCACCEISVTCDALSRAAVKELNEWLHLKLAELAELLQSTSEGGFEMQSPGEMQLLSNSVLFLGEGVAHLEEMGLILAKGDGNALPAGEKSQNPKSHVLPKKEDLPNQVQKNEKKTFTRQWITFISFTTLKIAKDFCALASAKNLSGFLMVGKPGLCCVESFEEKTIQDFITAVRKDVFAVVDRSSRKMKIALVETDLRVCGESGRRNFEKGGGIF